MAEPAFTVVIPTHGRPALLDEAIRSVLAQEELSLECVVVDDAGDPPARVPADGRVRLVRHRSNRGLSAARNTGIRMARGRAITFLDDDDLLAPDRLTIARQGLARAPVAICFRGDYPGGTPGRNRRLDGDVLDQILDEAVPHVGQACVAREVIPAFDDELRAGEEIDWWLRLVSSNHVVTVPRIGYLFRVHEGARDGNGADVRVRARLTLLERYAPYFRTHRTADAFQWMRLGLLAEQAGDRPTARRAFARSLARRPRPNVAWHLARSLGGAA